MALGAGSARRRVEMPVRIPRHALDFEIGVHATAQLPLARQTDPPELEPARPAMPVIASTGTRPLSRDRDLGGAVVRFEAVEPGVPGIAVEPDRRGGAPIELIAGGVKRGKRSGPAVR